MPANYDTLSTVPTVELQGAAPPTPGVIFTARAKPSAVIFSLFIANVDLVPSHLSLIVPVVADFVNNAAAVEGVDSMTIYQDVNNQGEFINKVDVTVVSSSGNLSQEISPPYGSLASDQFANIVGRTRANLDAIEGE